LEGVHQTGGTPGSLLDIIVGNEPALVQLVDPQGHEHNLRARRVTLREPAAGLWFVRLKRKSLPAQERRVLVEEFRATKVTMVQNPQPERRGKGCRVGMSLIGPGICLDETPVDVASYLACVRRGACPSPGRYLGGEPAHGLSPRTRAWVLSVGRLKCHANSPTIPGLPINCVTWQMAESYCYWQGKRLPTALELETATTPRHLPPLLFVDDGEWTATLRKDSRADWPQFEVYDPSNRLADRADAGPPPETANDVELQQEQEEERERQEPEFRCALTIEPEAVRAP
jgi:hypothetical protein